MGQGKEGQLRGLWGGGGWGRVLSQDRGAPQRSLNAVGSWLWDLAGRFPGDTGPVPASGAFSESVVQFAGLGFEEPCVGCSSCSVGGRPVCPSALCGPRAPCGSGAAEARGDGSLGKGLWPLRTAPLLHPQDGNLCEGLGEASPGLLRAPVSQLGWGPHLPPTHRHWKSALEGVGAEKDWTTCLPSPRPLECRKTGWYLAFAEGWGKENVLRPARPP